MKKTSIFRALELQARTQIEDYLASQPQFSVKGLTPLFINGHQYGWLESCTAAKLLHFSERWIKQDGKVELQGKDIADELQQAARYLQQEGLIGGWRNESYGVYAEDEHGQFDFTNSLCSLERASFRRYGFLSRAVHINAYYPDGTLSLGRRASTKSIDPNLLDNMAAGGIPMGELVLDCAIRELKEEAGVTRDVAKRIEFVETIHIQRNESDGTHNEILYCFDLALPEDFVPCNQDGEVATFYRLDQMDAINSLELMTWDAGRTSASFLLRKGRLSL
ncbi:DUF4743 domain-containing protein [Deefgea tanakiae]|uniref:DUF4743 domain-containing protein n=1 Tax=Deefgea tanakiae TaxID=2865840 RepID=A0ABX8ZCU4_9NEIS|nr:DUF4743 domain-containing protein [Deefgea tanakiae]QZA78990.1 DUF4743 domain-containing protein [Deefgea tanakiae]